MLEQWSTNCGAQRLLRQGGRVQVCMSIGSRSSPLCSFPLCKPICNLQRCSGDVHVLLMEWKRRYGSKKHHAICILVVSNPHLYRWESRLCHARRCRNTVRCKYSFKVLKGDRSTSKVTRVSFQGFREVSTVKRIKEG